MHGGGNRIYGRHMIIHNVQFAECEVLEIYKAFVVEGQGLEVRGQGLVNWFLGTWRTFVEDYNTGLGTSRRKWSHFLNTCIMQSSRANLYTFICTFQNALYKGCPWLYHAPPLKSHDLHEFHCCCTQRMAWGTGPITPSPRTVTAIIMNGLWMWCMQCSKEKKWRIFCWQKKRNGTQESVVHNWFWCLLSTTHALSLISQHHRDRVAGEGRCVAQSRRTWPIQRAQGRLGRRFLSRPGTSFSSRAICPKTIDATSFVTNKLWPFIWVSRA